MKNILNIFILLALLGGLSANLFAQAPNLINYQALAYNANGNTINNTAISVRVSILQGSSSGVIAYQETHNPATDANGAFSIQIGGGSPQQGMFNDVDWGGYSHYLRIEMDASGGTNYTVMGTSQMVSVPYAKYAEKAGRVGGAVSSELHSYIFSTPDLEFIPIGCDSSTSGPTSENFLAIRATSTPNKIFTTGATYVQDFTYNPATLEVTASTFSASGSIFPFLSGTISSNFNTITLYYDFQNGAPCTQLRYIYTRQ